jgi:hypothetical protein
MRIGRSFFIAGLAASLIAPVAMAQVGAVMAGGGMLGGITGKPYSATRKTTRVQTLANGTTINRETIVKEARDSMGRTYREIHQEAQEGAEENDFATVLVFDPVNRVSISWNTRIKQATINHMPDLEQARSEATTMPMIETRPRETAPASAPQMERLGVQTINGVSATGIRVTRVIPAGKEGNDQPITITTETWRSTELRVVVRNIDDDPRSGLTTTELTDIEQDEPSPSLFQAPEGYTVKEHFPQQNQN